MTFDDRAPEQARGEAMTPEERRLLESLDRALGADGPGADDATFASLRQACVGAFAEVSRADDLRARRVARSVLARTTREDLRRRRDVGLVLDFVADRLRASAWLRIAAALLIVQLTLVPLVAWHMVGKVERPHFNVRFEEALEELSEDLPLREELPELVDDDPVLPDMTPLPLAAEAPLPSGAEVQWLAGLELPSPTTEVGAALERVTATFVGLDARAGSPEVAWRGLARLLDQPFDGATWTDLSGSARTDWIAALALELARSGTDDPYVGGWVRAASER